jgi:anti-anti-sigma regulatory factor
VTPRSDLPVLPQMLYVSRVPNLEMERLEPGVVAVRGEIDLTATDGLVAFARDAIGADGLVIDMRGVRMLDPMGLEALLEIRTALDGRTLTLRNVPERVAAVLEIVRANEWPNVVVDTAV